MYVSLIVSHAEFESLNTIIRKSLVALRCILRALLLGECVSVCVFCSINNISPVLSVGLAGSTNFIFNQPKFVSMTRTHTNIAHGACRVLHVVQFGLEGCRCVFGIVYRISVEQNYLVICSKLNILKLIVRITHTGNCQVYAM